MGIFAKLQILGDYILRSGVQADTVSGRGYVIDHGGRAGTVKKMLAQPDAYITFIVGLPGIGKTTVAQQVFHDIYHSFAIRCFIQLDNFKEDSKSRKEVLKKIQRAVKHQVKGWGHDYLTVPDYLDGKKVLIILDNVQKQSQLDALRKEVWLKSNSRLIVTTTNSHLGSQSNTFEVTFLKDYESRKLFCHYAFQKTAKPYNLANSLQQVIKRCGNFPLSLKSLGRYLDAEDVHNENLWSGLLLKLEYAEDVADSSDYEFWAKLKPCYYALNPSEQEMFLDVAVVFWGLPFIFVECIWNASGLCPDIGWRKMKRAFLVTEEGGHVRMHELLRNLGRSIACPKIFFKKY